MRISMISDLNPIKYGRTTAVINLKKQLENEGLEVYINNNFRKADIIHAHTPFHSTLFASRIFKEKPLLGTIHSLPTSYRVYFNSKIIPKLAWKYFRWIYSRFDKIIAPTKFVQSVLLNFGIKSEVISNGVDLSEFKRSRKSAKEFKEKFGLEKFVFSAGRWFDKRKNSQIIHRLAKEFPDVVFAHAGSRINRINLLRPKKLREIENLRFLGYLKRKDMVGAYSSSEIFLHPSKFETEGLVVLEAMACSNPVVAKDLEVYKGLLTQKNSFLCRNFLDFKKALETSIANERLRRKMAKNARKSARKRSIKKTCRKYIEVYENLLK